MNLPLEPFWVRYSPSGQMNEMETRESAAEKWTTDPRYEGRGFRVARFGPEHDLVAKDAEIARLRTALEQIQAGGDAPRIASEALAPTAPPPAGQEEMLADARQMAEASTWTRDADDVAWVLTAWSRPWEVVAAAVQALDTANRKHDDARVDWAAYRRKLLSLTQEWERPGSSDLSYGFNRCAEALRGLLVDAP